MASSRIRVTPVHRFRHVLFLAAAAAMGSALGIGRLLEWIQQQVMSNPMGAAWQISLQVIPVFIPVVVWGLVIVRRTQRRRTVVLSSGVFMLVFVFTLLVKELLGGNTGGGIDLDGLATSLLEGSLAVAVATAMGAAIGWIIHAAARGLAFSIVEQTGTNCWRCGYERGDGPITVCPECALPVTEGRCRGAWFVNAFDRAQRASPVILALLAALGVMWSAWRITAVTLPVHRFMRSLDPTGERRTMWLYVPPGRTPEGQWWESVIAIPTRSDPTRALLVQYFPLGPDAAGANRRVRGRISWSVTPGQGVSGTANARWPDEGTVRIYCDLSAEQMRAIIAAGAVPAALEEALARRAAEVSWAPSAAAYGPTPAPESVIDASEYLR